MGSVARKKGKLAAIVALTLAAPFVQGSTGRLTSLDDRLLAAHNGERAAAGLPAMDWDAELAAEAAEWGQELAKIEDIEHSPDDPEDPEPQGENLWLGTKGHYTPEDMVGAWIEEKAVYRHGVFPNVSATGDLDDVGHYTQLMWRNTGSVGCAVVDSRKYEILVCRYLTAGNVEGERAF
jgi:hypothetical protein